MPKLVTQLAQGNAYGQTAEENSGAFTASRSWKVILNSPGEVWDVNQAVGVNIGDPYQPTNRIPCVSIEARADGESRLVRIVTATYRATLGGSPGGGGEDPKTQEPTVRPALYSMSTSLTEIAAWGGRPVVGGQSQGWIPAINPAGDLVDSVTRLEPVVNINIDQYSASDMSNIMGYSGYVNSQAFTFSGLTIGTHCCMLQGISSTPVVEQFGDTTFRGFKVTFQFAVRAHYTITRDGPQAIGWDVASPQTGFTIINDGLDRADVDQQALCLAVDDSNKVIMLADNRTPAALAKGTQGKRMRAMVSLAVNEGFTQRPASQPVALNDDGTPRNVLTQTPKVYINRICLQPEMAFGNNFSAFGIRWYS